MYIRCGWRLAVYPVLPQVNFIFYAWTSTVAALLGSDMFSDILVDTVDFRKPEHSATRQTGSH
jgi:hypothetical protein